MIVVIYLWQITPRYIPFAILRMALDSRVVRKFSGVTFAKMLGTGKGDTFTPRDANSLRWGLLVVINKADLENLEKSKIITRWRNRNFVEYRALLSPISSHGLWSKRNPFDFITPISSPDAEIAAITRARISWRKNFRFWSAVPPVTLSLRQSPGLIAAIGIGEAPIGLQGTFSHWKSAAALREFAYKGAAHQEAIAATARHNWYSEELFARFEIIDVQGSISSLEQN